LPYTKNTLFLYKIFSRTRAFSYLILVVQVQIKDGPNILIYGFTNYFKENRFLPIHSREETAHVAQNFVRFVCDFLIMIH